MFNNPALLRYLEVARWTWGVLWRTAPTLTLGATATTLVRGLVPAGQAIAAKGLIDTTVPQIGAAEPTLSPVLPWLIAGLVLTALDAVLLMLRDYLDQRTLDELSLEVTSNVLHHATELDVSYFDGRETQDALQRAQHQPAEHFASFSRNTFLGLASLFQAASLTVLLVVLEPLTLIAVVVLALPFILFQSSMATSAYEIEHARAERRRWNRYFVQLTTRQPSVSEIKVLGIGPHLVKRFRDLMRGFRDENRTVYLKGFFGSSLFATLSTVVFYGLMVRVVLRTVEGAATLGDIAIFAGATAGLRGAVQQGAAAIKHIKESSLHLGVLKSYLDERPRIAAGGEQPNALGGSVAFQGLTFIYPGASRPALQNIDLHIEPGETLALVGENGSGKSTLVKLLARLYEPTSGTIRLGGTDLRTLSADSLRRHVSFVFQDFTRYEATAADNIAYGDWEAFEALGPEAARKRVKDVAQTAGASRAIEDLPQGYDTHLGPLFGDHVFSGGQWQSIAVARAFAREVQLLILDEPTANLDVRAEHDLFLRFQELAKGRTTILISHRFSTVSMADRIVVMDRGQIAEHGTHQELMKLGRHYAELYKLQRREQVG